MLTIALGQPDDPTPPIPSVRATVSKISTLASVFDIRNGAPVRINSKPVLTVAMAAVGKAPESLLTSDLQPANFPSFPLKAPELLHQAGPLERMFIWNVVLQPAQDPADIVTRRGVITAIMIHPEFDQVRDLKSACYRTLAAVSALLTPIPMGGKSWAALTLVLTASTNHESQRAHDAVMSAFEQLSSTRDTPARFAAVLRGVNHRILDDAAARLELLAARLKGFTPASIPARTIDVPTVSEMIDELTTVVAMTGALIELASLVRSGRLGRCEFDVTKPQGYTAGWNPLIPESESHKNDSPADSHTVVFTGSNMSGKTATGLKQNLFIRLFAQAWGHATCDGGNFHDYDSFFYIEPGTSNHQLRLSSFGTDVVTFSTTYRDAGERPCMFIDEGYSSTDLVGQFKLSVATKDAPKLQAGRLYLSSHSEPFNASMSRMSNVSVYHFRVESEPDGKLRFTYVLTPGIEDSNSIAVARDMKLEPEFVAAVERALDGQLPDPEVTPLVEVGIHPRLLADDIRTIVKSGMPANLFMEGRCRVNRSLAALVVHTEDFSLNAGRYLPGLVQSSNGNVPLLSNDALENTERLILCGALPSPDEMAERQQMFAEMVRLGSPAVYWTLAEELHALTDVVAEDPQHLADLRNLNRLSVPFFEPLRFSTDHFDTIRRSYSYAGQAVIDFLKCHKRILGDKFEHDELLETAERERAELGMLLEAVESTDPKVFLEELIFARLPAEIPAAIEALNARDRRMPSDIDAFTKTLNEAEAVVAELGHVGTPLTPRNLQNLRPLAEEADERNTLDEGQERTYERSNKLSRAETHVRDWLVKCLRTAENRSIYNVNEALVRTFVKLTNIAPRLPRRRWDRFSADEIGGLESSLFLAGKSAGIDGYFRDVAERSRFLLACVRLLKSQRNVAADTCALLRRHDSVHLHRLANDLENTVQGILASTNPSVIFERLGIALPRGKDRSADVYGIAAAVYGSDKGAPRDMVQRLGRICEELDAIFQAARIIQDQAWCRVNFSTDGAFEIKGGGNLIERKKHVPQDFHFTSDHRIHLMTGPNMSGKSFRMKAVIPIVCAALQTGFAPAQSVIMPRFERVFFADRSNQKTRGLSGAGHEFVVWKDAIPLIRSGALMLFIGDEPFSTTSHRYQDAFIGTAACLLAQGRHYGILATHHHGVVTKLTRVSPVFQPWHLGFVLGEDRRITYTYVAKRGQAESHAIPTARRLGFPAEVADIADAVEYPE